MKRIYLRKAPDDRFPDPSTVEYRQALFEWAELIRQVIRRPLDVQRGADIDELRKGIRVLDALDKASENVLELEDNDWEHLKAKTLAMQWLIIDRRVVWFVDDIVNATEQLTLNAQFEALRE